MAEALKLRIFLVVSAAIVALSWKSLRNPRFHGFFRFFALEFILLLILFNIEHWFVEPFAPRQIASWMLLLISLLLAMQSFYLFRRLGKPGGRVEGSPNLKFENTTQLVRSGAYKYIRHPMYCSLLLFAGGAFLKDASTLYTILAFGVPIFLYATAKVEERENIQRFGKEYEEYIKGTKMFLPFLF